MRNHSSGQNAHRRKSLAQGSVLRKRRNKKLLTKKHAKRSFVKHIFNENVIDLTNPFKVVDMNDLQRIGEIHRCNNEIAKTEEVIKYYRCKKDQLRFDKCMEQLAFLLLKHIILTDFTIDLNTINKEDLEDFVENCKAGIAKVNLLNHSKE